MNRRSQSLDRRLAMRLRRQQYRQLSPQTTGPHELHHHQRKHPPQPQHKEIRRHQELSAKLHDQLLRTQAEFENYRKRSRREIKNRTDMANKELLEDLLPVLDNFNRALASPGGSVEALLSGIEMVHKQFIDHLAQHGLEKVEAQGQPFDPNLHEAVATVPSNELPENTVTEVLQDGYTLNGRLVRPAMVKVARD
jgi:molecular chaperone GrpE